MPNQEPKNFSKIEGSKERVESSEIEEELLQIIEK